MGDLISREAAISAMYLLQIEDEETYGCKIVEGFDGERAADALRRLPSAEPEVKWIPVTERLPIDGSLVIACSPYGGITIVYFRKGISQEDRTKMKNGEIDDPSEEIWCLSEGYSKSKRSGLFRAEDEWGNNQKAYAWHYGPFHYSGQDFVAWMPLPEPWRGE